ncbi:hypothetical protein Taro_034942 [Colocasia esculenta]|uniref:Uncharacterized protein n=1 Tax=Colocasia esculenta TaxID=4460 RepID=A0A843VZ41_COLES|nr:hypothetical protein [Colocasia esculenta]
MESWTLHALIWRFGASSGDLQQLEASLDIGGGFLDHGLEAITPQNPEESSFGGFLGLPKESFNNTFDPFGDLLRGNLPGCRRSRVVPLTMCLVVVLARVGRFALFLAPCVLSQMGGGAGRAVGAVSRTVVTFVVKCVALSACVVGAVPCLLWRVLPISCVVSAVGATVLHLAEFWCLWWHPVLVLEWFVFVPSGALVHYVALWVAPGACVAPCVVFYFLIVALSVVRQVLVMDCVWLGFPILFWIPPEVDVLSSTSAVVSVSVRFADVSGCLALPTSGVFSGFASMRSGGFRLAISVALVGLVRATPKELSTSSCVLCAVVVHPVSCRMSGLALSYGRVVVVTTGKSRCVGDPVMWHPGGRPSYWCRDHRARRDTRGGVAPVGRGLIVAHEAVAIRVSRPGCPLRQGSCRDAWPCCDRVVVTWFTAATRALSRSASPTRLACCGFPTRRDEIAMGLEGATRSGLPQVFSVVAVGVSACAPGQGCPPDLLVRNAAGWLAAFSDRSVPVSQAVPCVPALADGPSGGFRKGCRACLCLLGLTPIPACLCQRGLLRAAGVLGPASLSHCLALRWFRSHVGRWESAAGVHPTAVPVGSACGPSTLWRSEVAVPVSHVVAPVFRELLCLDGFASAYVDSAGFAGVVFGLTRVVVEAFTMFLLLCSTLQ